VYELGLASQRFPWNIDLTTSIAEYTEKASASVPQGKPDILGFDANHTHVSPERKAFSIMIKFCLLFDLKARVSLLLISFFIAGPAFGDVIINNGDPQTTFTGTWSISGGAKPFSPTDPNPTSLWSRNGTTYTWTFTPTDSGYHAFSMWWTEWSSRSADIPVDIEHAGGTDRVFINQKENGGQWNLLDTYFFEADVNYDITITSQPGPSSTCADAVRFVFLSGGNVAPVAVIDSISPSPALTDDLITFIGHGEDFDGSIAAYSWTSSIDGNLGDQASFTTEAPLSTGTHTISFTVYDDDGEPSQTVIQTLFVQSTLTEVIIDNGDANTTFTGDWSVSGGPNPWDQADANPTSLWSRNGSTYTWTFTPQTSGNYDLSMWWTQWPSRSDSIPVTIEHVGGTDTIPINQKANGGRWNSLGSYPFAEGVEYNVTITSQPGPSSTCADAVKFVYNGGSINTPPLATIDVIMPPAAVPGEEVSFMGTGNVSNGLVSAYEWRSDIDGLLSNQENFSTVLLSSGIHTILFRVRDDQGSWSDYANALVVVRDCDSPVAIMPLGDSNTQGFGQIPNGDLMTGYRALLHQQLVNGGYNIDFVGNRNEGLLVTPPYDINHQGIGGISAAFVADNVFSWLVENPAEVVLLHIGTNDFSTNPSDVEDILDEIDRYETIRGKDVAVILAKIINRRTYHSATTVFNENLQAMAQNRIASGDKIVIVDQESALNYPEDMWDLLHPNNQGYSKMPPVWMDELLGLLPVCNTFSPFIYTTPLNSASIGAEFVYQAASIGRPAPQYSLLTAPGGMSIDENTGEITWTPAVGQSGNHTVTVRASNAEGNSDQSFTVEVAAETVIIDNGDSETSFTGSWSVSSGANPFNPQDAAANSLWSRDGTTYTWTFTPSISGTFDVSMWWTQYPSRSNSVPVRIEHAGGTANATINQQNNGGRWNVIGSYVFTADVSYRVTITAQPGPSSTSADAVRFRQL
jgi:lysophospholipase L1-like esterase